MRSIVCTLACFLFACSSNLRLSTDGGDTDADAGAPEPIGGGEGGLDVYIPPPPPNCDLTKLPKDDACVIDESAGVFVSSSLGDDTSDGTRAKPLKSIKAGLALAKATAPKRRVYVCAESYAEAISFEDGVSLFGYFDCAGGWKVTAKRATIASPTSPAATARDVAKPTRVEGFEITAPDAVAPSGSSIGVLAVNTTAMKLVDVRVRAGKGGAGKDGVDAPQLTDSGSAKNGADGSGNFWCNTNTVACIAGPSAAGGTNACTGKVNKTGGAGGKGGAPGLEYCDYNIVTSTYFWSHTDPGNGDAQPANAQTNQGGVAKTFTAPKNGDNGNAGTAGAASASVGKFDPNALYAPADGAPGSDGDPGQGGGGFYGRSYPYYFGTCDSSSYGRRDWGTVGGGGGAGGCPGLGGEAGKGGGASVALLAFASPITLESCALESGAGGAGGKGGFGGAGLAGGAGGSGQNGSGGSGGAGGDGGSGSNGSGGPSFAIASSGTAPSATSTQLTPGAGGAGVAARTQGNMSIPASPDGKSAATFTF